MTVARYPNDMRVFVCNLRDQGVSLTSIVATVKAKWPGRFPEFHENVAAVLYPSRKQRSFDQVAAENVAQARVPKGGTCQHRALLAGKLHVCGADGYPYCSEHKAATAPLAASRYTFATSRRF